MVDPAGPEVAADPAPPTDPLRAGLAAVLRRVLDGAPAGLRAPVDAQAARALQVLASKLGVDLPAEPPGGAARGWRGDLAAAGRFVAIVGVDRFAGLRRQVGPEVAGDVLRELARRVLLSVPQARLGRVGGSTVEFAFPCAGPEPALAVLQGLHAVLEQALPVDGRPVALPVYIGAACADGSAALRDEVVLEYAEQALGLARAGQVKCAIFGEKDWAEASERLALMRDLRSALAREALSVVYQPKLNNRAGRVDSVEALVRWRHPERGQVPPDSFIGLAEGTGDIRALTEFVLKRTVDDQLRLRARGHDLSFHVNLSGGLVADEEFCAWTLAQCARSDGRVGVEITETAVIADPARALANLRALSGAGVSIAIDDYGSGLSSLAYLKEFPADELKIDRRFVSGLASSHRDPLLVRSTIDLAHALDMEVTAEGVDNPTSLALLGVMGCDRMQGFQIAPPLEFGALERFLVKASTFTAAARPALRKVR